MSKLYFHVNDESEFTKSTNIGLFNVAIGAVVWDRHIDKTLLTQRLKDSDALPNS